MTNQRLQAEGTQVIVSTRVWVSACGAYPGKRRILYHEKPENGNRKRQGMRQAFIGTGFLLFLCG
jgi:hypothetical protein